MNQSSVRAPAAARPAARAAAARRRHSTAAPRSSLASQQAATAAPVFHYTEIELQTGPGISVHNIMPQLRAEVARLGVAEGFVNVLSRHTTTAVCINEYETRLLDDIRQFLRRLAPPTDPYLHNDLHLREAPEGWPGGWEAWAQQEPENAHSHLLSLMLGNSETVPISGGELKTGVWQSVMLVELDGPRKRSVGVQIVGTAPPRAGGQQ
ncbi:secondary thiamine-phosphate synthase enzyme [Raphidocelis subcapitata]|uniref:Secondary thiamine-phosphate synthase enzyme n=1 Tax=Raphidocelis subcapitata TaxID=307507 RepID=A0A2V0NRH5_9CHLO|nr:secondary thiamine-phosphate synthase enzyme [Raphidocelis subcapitata]|eukprot:GBF87527.1 secondary thiamine-phosphate synthase enzyme [Raphidocelis subcapitata]